MADAVFDLDGTLVDSVLICTDIVNAMLVDRQSDHRVSSADTRAYVSLGGARMMSGLLGRSCGDPEVEIGEFRSRYAARPTPEASLFPGVRRGLAELRDQRIRLTICSAKPQNLCEKVLADLGLADLFSAVVGSRQGAPCKPDPAHLDEVLARVGGCRTRACFIGDSEVDFDLAQRAGVPFILMTYGYASDVSDLSDAHTADHFHHVPGIVMSLLSSSRSAAAQ
jgi:phosphoglycolate phosphatase